MSDKPPRLPVVTPAGDMLAYMSAAARRRTLDGVFFDIGGRERFAHEANKQPWEFYKMWAKGPLPVTQNNTEHSVNSASVESMWDKIEARKKAAAAGPILDTTVIAGPILDITVIAGPVLNTTVIDVTPEAQDDPA